jgi:hypothetical protein
MNFVKNNSKNINNFVLIYEVNILNKYYKLTPRNVYFIVLKKLCNIHILLPFLVMKNILFI